MSDLKPIETRYRGYRFRSRLEAKWAVFYDALHLNWIYEMEGFDLGGGLNYLPDFFFPDLKIWIEIKAERPTPIESEKADRLARAAGQSVYIFFGDIPHVSGLLETVFENAWVFYPNGAWDVSQHWCECSICGKLGIEFMGRGEHICGAQCGGAQWHTDSTPRFRAAYEKARSTRFEHGGR